MNEFGNYLYSLRKSKGMTQQELADMLGVTNKAISKWETGEAFPETAQLIPLSDIFGVTVDDLLRGRAKENITPPETHTPKTALTNRDIKTLSQQNAPEEWKRKFALLICFGVGLMLAGVLSVIISGLLPEDNLVIILCTCGMLALIAIGVNLCIIAGIVNDNAFAFSDKSWRKNVNRFTRFMVLGFSCIMLGVICFVLSAAFEEKTPLFITGITVGFIILFSGVTFYVYGGITWGSYFKKITTEIEYAPSPVSEKEVRKEKLSSTINSIIMMTAVIIFLLLGFLGNLWHPGWVVFPIGGILCGIASVILGKE